MSSGNRTRSSQCTGPKQSQLRPIPVSRAMALTAAGQTTPTPPAQPSTQQTVTAHQRTTDEWWKHAVIYENLSAQLSGFRRGRHRRHQGNYVAAGLPARPGHRRNLDHADVPSPGVDYGYDISDYTAIDPVYGTMADFDRLVSEAKKREIRVIMDYVINHTSDQHEWFKESRSSRTNPKRDWYIWRDGKRQTAGNKGEPPTTGSRGLATRPGPGTR